MEIKELNRYLLGKWDIWEKSPSYRISPNKKLLISIDNIYIGDNNGRGEFNNNVAISRFSQAILDEENKMIIIDNFLALKYDN